MKMTEYESEPIPGLPEKLPAGEKILWQDSPTWHCFAKHVFHVNKVSIYFTVLVLIHMFSNVYANQSLFSAIQGALWFVVLAFVTIGLLLVFAYLFSKSTIYTVTNHRLVLRFGVAIQIMINLPWDKVDQADLKLFKDASGDITLTLLNSEKMSYLVMWPHVKPWRFSKVKPMLRNVPNAIKVAEIIANALDAETQKADILKNTKTNSKGLIFGKDVDNLAQI